MALELSDIDLGGWRSRWPIFGARCRQRNHFDLLAALLEDPVVDFAAGAAAVRALSEAFHIQAGKVYASGLDDWVETFRAVKLRVHADGQGAAGAATQARTSPCRLTGGG